MLHRFTRLFLCVPTLLLAGCAALNDSIDDALMRRAPGEEAQYNAEVRAKVQILHAGIPQQVEMPAALRSSWGVLGDWAGNFYLEGPSHLSEKAGASFRWVNPGYVLEKVQYAHDRFEPIARILFWYEPATRSIQTDRRPFVWYKGEFELMLGDDGAMTLRDRKSNEVTASKIVPTKNGYVLEESGVILSGKRPAVLSSEADIRKQIALFHDLRELERRASSARWSEIGGALSAGVTQGVAQANTEQRARQLEQNRQRSAFMAAQSESTAREQQARERSLAQRPAESRTVQSQNPKPPVAAAPAQANRLASTSGTSTQTRTGTAPPEKTTGPSAPRPSTASAPVKPALGPARAWCMRKKNGEFSCNGPLQNGGWGATLKGALKMVDCTNGRGFTPTIGGGGELFQCERDLRPGEKVMPASDPWR